MSFVRPAVTIVAGLIVSVAANATDPLFESHDTLQVRIDAPIEQVLDHRDSGDYYDGLFRYNDANGGERALDIKLRARGRYRRQVRTCRFPPIRLNFRKKQVDGTLFDGQDKLKLVTHCRTGSDRYEQLLLREYLAYRFLQTLTDNSFRVRLLRIAWTDTHDANESFEHYGFVLEDEDRLGKRLGLEASGIRQIPPERLLPSESSIVGVFEYMIGNTDFSVIAGPPDEKCCHNVVPYEQGEKLLPIPYDFDFSGAVDAPYASPNPRFKIRSVKTRLYRGRCEHNEHLAATFQLFNDRRPEIDALIMHQEGVDDRVRQRVARYINDFYEVINDEGRVNRHFIRNCIS